MRSLRTLFRRRGTGDERAVRRGEASEGVRVTSGELIGLRRAARDLHLVSRRPVLSSIAGGHASRFRGRGMDYLESRGYQAGDDIRNMDWRVTARAGEPHVKLYTEERERPVVLMVDLNPGMFFGTRGAFKSVIAARAAALIGWAAARHHDRIGALLYNGSHHELRPLGGQRGVLRLIRTLVDATAPDPALREPHQSGTLTGALQRLRRVARPGSLIYILSDFYDIDADTRVHLQRLRQHSDVVACQVTDALEIHAPAPGRYGISDGRHTTVLDTHSAARQAAYERYFAQHHRDVRDLMRACAVPLIRLTTSDDVVERLRSSFAEGSLPGATGVEVAA
jgi:uncharacterized protein (DUF58 family)